MKEMHNVVRFSDAHECHWNRTFESMSEEVKLVNSSHEGNQLQFTCIWPFDF